MGNVFMQQIDKGDNVGRELRTKECIEWCAEYKLLRRRVR